MFGIVSSAVFLEVVGLAKRCVGELDIAVEEASPGRVFELIEHPRLAFVGMRLKVLLDLGLLLSGCW